MHYFIKLIIIFLFAIVLQTSAMADPWFTGPLLAPSGHTIPNGHTNFEMYGLDVNTNGSYNNTGQIIHRPEFKSIVANPVLSHGFTDWLDVQLTLPYVFNATRGVKYNRIGDTAISLGFQLWEQKKSPKSIDVRILLQEIFPTGRYEQLNPTLLGTDATGLGSYQTQVGLNLQYLLVLPREHYLRTRFIVAHLYASSVEVQGLNSYGGTESTFGRIRPGSEDSLDLAFEYTLTQHWVAVLEGTYAKGQATRFNGILTIQEIGGPDASIGSDQYHQTSLAPALEYNFTGNLGLIGGVWFPVSGKNTSHFMTYMLALNAFW